MSGLDDEPLCPWCDRRDEPSPERPVTIRFFSDYSDGPFWDERAHNIGYDRLPTFDPSLEARLRHWGAWDCEQDLPDEGRALFVLAAAALGPSWRLVWDN